ncbi:hypothetical protein [Spirosoma sordidisoli]|uniref:Uncharacterized protein n=1 Tax=Spirosoma sordidisoli TaxID=2502893 RepID=A0A4Q2UQV1_9BACT|nr:hypothetical protein [Spirosoma sordidisoli]RYC70030.1 hypothetical protein EQG79_09170 [Spirosoma sordidisoli]
MHYYTLTIADIMERNVLFYDAENEDACRTICQTLNLDNLPALDGRSCYFLDDDGNFTSQPIPVGSCVRPHERLFDDSILNKFRQASHNVLFVYEDEDCNSNFLAVVHISDFNRDVVIQTIQDDILVFERTLRQFLILLKETNTSIDTYLKTESPKKRNNKLKKPYDNYAPFQQYNLSDLLDFARHLSYPGVHYDDLTIKAINKNLRNTVMHGKNVVELVSNDHYSIESLNELDFNLKKLAGAYFTLRSAISKDESYITTKRALNQSKLKLIAQSGQLALRTILELG